VWLEVLIVPLTGATAQIIPPFEWPSKSTELQPWEHYLFALVYIFLQLYSTKQAYYDGIWKAKSGFPRVNAAFHGHALEPVVQVLRHRSQLRPRWFDDLPDLPTSVKFHFEATPLAHHLFRISKDNNKGSPPAWRKYTVRPHKHSRTADSKAAWWPLVEESSFRNHLLTLLDVYSDVKLGDPTHITAAEAYKGEKQPVGAPRKFYAPPGDDSLVVENKRLKTRIKELEDDCEHHLRREDIVNWKRIVTEILDERQMEVARTFLAG